jgi:hypothetical protein
VTTMSRATSSSASRGLGWFYHWSGLVLRAKVDVAAKGDDNATTYDRCCYHLVAEVLQRTNDNATNSPHRCYQPSMTVLQEVSEVLPAGVGMLPAVHRRLVFRYATIV